MKTIYGKDFGILPNTREDSTYTINKMIQENPYDTTFILEPGRYDFSVENAIEKEYYLSNTDVINPRKLGVLLENMNNIIFDGNGADFVFHGSMMPITSDNSQDITIKNLTIDWDIPLTAEGIIVGASESYADIKIDKNLFPYKMTDKGLLFYGENWEYPVWEWGCTEFDAHTKKVAYQSGDTFSTTTQEELPNGVIRFYGNFTIIPTTGNHLVLRHNRRVHAGMFLSDSKNVCIDNVTIHNTGGLGILTQFCDTVSFKKIKFIPNRDKGRYIISGHDDGLHLSNNMGHISVEDCYFYGLMDDPLNIHGTSTLITTTVDKNTLHGEFVHNQAYGFSKWALPGHEISFLRSSSMESLGVGIVKEFKMLTEKTFEISFEQILPDDFDGKFALENLTRTASLTCRNNFFGNCRARGILISTPKPVLIENNIFESAGSAILVAGDANEWYESGACREIVIRNNYFADCCMTSIYQFCNAIISICPEVPAPVKELPFHSNIHIYGNTFNAFDYPVLYALSTNNISFTDNRIFRSYTYEPIFKEKKMFTLEYCSDVKIQNNLLIGDVLGKDVELIGMDQNDISIEI